MSVIKLNYDWIDFAGADLEPVKLTFANLSIIADDRVVTRVLDRRARTTRDNVTTPLYPLAEWAVANWWPLLNEPEVPSRGITTDDYLDRHAIRRAREGYSLPDLRIIPEGSWTRLEWHPWATAHQTVDFLVGGECRVRTDSVEQLFSDLIDSVIERLRANRVMDSWLEIEWRAVQETTKEESEFCLAAARLGLNPYETNAATDDSIVSVCNGLPEHLWEDVLAASPAAQLSASAEWVKLGLKAVENHAGAKGNWQALRARIQAIQIDDFPWKQGYRMAQHVRQSLGVGDVTALDLADLAGEPFPIVLAKPAPTASLDGVIGAGGDVPCCYTAKRSVEAQRFLCSRGLFDFFFRHSQPSTVLSSAALQDQQRGRAFAAELLAPAAIIKSKISGDEIGGEEIEDLAAQFRVSPLVVGYQIKNHGLAKVAA